jgi:hypothetical protein
MRSAFATWTRTPWAARLALVSYALLLTAAALTPGGRAGVAGAGFFDLTSGSRIRAMAVAIGVYTVLEIARFVPMGVLAVLSTPGPRPLTALSGAGAAVASLAVAAAVLVLEIGQPWQVPGPSDFMLPAAGCALGVGAAVAWRGGRTVRRAILVLLATASVAVPVVLGAILFAAVEPEAVVQSSPAVTSDEKRRLYFLLRHKKPTRLAVGETRTIILRDRDLDLLLAWGLPLVLGEGRARASVDLASSTGANVALSVRSPWGAGYLNIVAGGRVGIERGELILADLRFRLGRFTVPETPLSWSSPLIAALLQAERRVRPVLAAVDRLEIAPGSVTLSYGRMELPSGMLASLIWGEGSRDEIRVATRTHLLRLIEAAPRLPPGERRFGAAVEVAFASARERSAVSSPILENRAAILALGIVAGHSRLEQFVGRVMDAKDWPRAAPLARTTLRGRADWTKHFIVSAALAVLSAQAPSDAAGLFKEELDAGGGSGFSFADLMADRAGTTFALLATRDEAAARALQEQLARGFRVDDFFPEAADLPENIQDAELKARYGGVSGPLFQKYAAEVERRLWSCPAYRELAPTS